MVFFILILLIIVSSGMRFYDDDIKTGTSYYLDKDKTTSINGIFVILIIFSHYSQYTQFNGPFDFPYICIQQHLNQMVVATFLFFSGYGMMESIKRKGSGYIKKIPTKFLQLLIRFDIVVCIFWIIGKAFLHSSYDYGVKNMLLSFLSWTAIGNSNWYITAILGLYVLMFVAFLPCIKKEHFIDNRRNLLVCCISFTFLAIAFVYFQMILDRDSYCYNTIILMPIGTLYSLYGEYIERIALRNNYTYSACLVVVFGVYIVSYFHRFEGIEVYSIWAIAFIGLVLLVMMRVSICNSLLIWFGNNIFGIYILQRIPMMILQYTGAIENHKYLSLLVVIVTTVLIAQVFQYLTDKLFHYVTNMVRKKT